MAIAFCVSNTRAKYTNRNCHNTVEDSRGEGGRAPLALTAMASPWCRWEGKFARVSCYGLTVVVSISQ
eukprot:2477761-Rhodomonas_salina.1